MTTPFSTIGQPSVPLGGQYFGQSSFARLAVVNMTSVVKVSGLLSPEELPKFAALGCGFQTGAGAIVNIAKAVPQDTVAVYGCGGVGLAAIMVSESHASYGPNSIAYFKGKRRRKQLVADRSLPLTGFPHDWTWRRP
jgi:Zn-dependent alcohol dehydrogenase